MMHRAETAPAASSPVARTTSFSSRCRRMAHAVAAAAIGIAAVAGCGDDDDTAGATTDAGAPPVTTLGEAHDAPATTSRPSDTSADEASPADLDARLACDLLERWGGEQAVEEHGVAAMELSAAAYSAGQAAAIADSRYEALGEASFGLIGTPELGDDAPPVQTAASVQTAPLIRACADVGYEIDEDAAQDDAAASEIAELACERAVRWDDEWTLDDLETEAGGTAGRQFSRRMAVARASVAADGYDDRFAGLGDAGTSLVTSLIHLDTDRFDDAIAELQQECDALLSG